MWPSRVTKNVCGIARTPYAAATAESLSMPIGRVACWERAKSRESPGMSW